MSLVANQLASRRTQVYVDFETWGAPGAGICERCRALAKAEQKRVSARKREREKRADGEGEGGDDSRCPRGHSCPEGTKIPEPCEAGTYSNELGLSVCKTCEAGQWCAHLSTAKDVAHKTLNSEHWIPFYKNPAGKLQHNQAACQA